MKDELEKDFYFILFFIFYFLFYFIFYETTRKGNWHRRKEQNLVTNLF